jgi:hypothetical protein
LILNLHVASTLATTAITASAFSVPFMLVVECGTDELLSVTFCFLFRVVLPVFVFRSSDHIPPNTRKDWLVEAVHLCDSVFVVPPVTHVILQQTDSFAKCLFGLTRS